AMVLIDAVVRLLPGVLGEAGSLSEESFAADLLEYPQFTRPREWEGHSIPAVLLSGDHARIARWRRSEAERLTQARRPDVGARRRRGAGSWLSGCCKATAPWPPKSWRPRAARASTRGIDSHPAAAHNSRHDEDDANCSATSPFPAAAMTRALRA